MSLLANLTVVLLAGIFTAIVCGLGTLPFFFIDDVSDRWTVALWGLASGIMLAASLFGFIFEGLAEGTLLQVGTGLLVGAALVIVANRAIHGHEISPSEIPQADFNKMLLIVGVLTVHSFPEGVALGVAFADIGLENGIAIAGISIPVLALIITAAISIQNIPEGLAVAIPLHTFGTSNWKIFGAAVLSSVPQPIGAGIAFVFVRIAREFLPFGFGFAAGAMIYLVLTEMIPEARDHGESLPNNGRNQLAIGLLIGILTMLPLLWVVEPPM